MKGWIDIKPPRFAPGKKKTKTRHSETLPGQKPSKTQAQRWLKRLMANCSKLTSTPSTCEALWSDFSKYGPFSGQKYERISEK